MQEAQPYLDSGQNMKKFTYFFFSCRGRPRTVSLDSESKIPKKRKKKRQHKYVDDDFSGSDEASNGDEVFENDTEGAALPSSISATSSESGNSNMALAPRGGFSNTSNSKNSNEAVVTCTVTTGLTHQFNGYNNGSILGFTLSIPSTSMSESNPALGSNHGFSSTALSSSTFSSNHLKKSNGLSSSSTSKSGSGVFCDFTEKITQETKKNEPFPVNSALVIQDEKRKNTVQDEVDEDYDDF